MRHTIYLAGTVMPSIPPELSPTRRHSLGQDDPLIWIGQADNINDIDNLGTGEWTTLYEFKNDKTGSRCFYSALLPTTGVSKALEHDSWDLRIGDGQPGFTRYYNDGNDLVKYERFVGGHVEPIVYSRNFHGIKPEQFDLSEEFRLYHNLYHDRSNDRYIHIDDRDDETVAVEVSSSSRIRAKTYLLRQYMAARQLALAIYFDQSATASVDVEVAKASFPRIEIASADRRYDFHIGEVMGRTFSRLIGKKIILPPPITEAGIWPYSHRSPQYAEFIIGVDRNGSPITHTSDPDALANYFGANEAAPHYLTPIWFTRNVLAKYYDDPNKYSVEDSYLRCGSLWGLRMDNNLSDHVAVYLGDLGRDLSYEEQVYWRHFNVTPDDRQTSETNYRRSFLAEFTDPSAPDLVFRQRYTLFSKAWLNEFGWSLYRPLHEGDIHILKQLRAPISDALGEFETQLLYLVKLLIDSLNEKELTAALGSAVPNEQGISKFERYLETKAYPFKDRDIRLLRTLQNLRSSATAHAKGRNFDKLKESVGLDRDSPSEVFRRLLEQANEMLADLWAHFALPAA